MSVIVPFQLCWIPPTHHHLLLFKPPWIDFITTIRGRHWLDKCIEIKRNSPFSLSHTQHKGGTDMDMINYVSSISSSMNEWPSDYRLPTVHCPVTIRSQPALVHEHWRLSSHAVHYPERGQLERDPKRPLIIIPFREEKKRREDQNNIYCNPTHYIVKMCCWTFTVWM